MPNNWVWTGEIDKLKEGKEKRYKGTREDLKYMQRSLLRAAQWRNVVIATKIEKDNNPDGCIIRVKLLTNKREEVKVW